MGTFKQTMAGTSPATLAYWGRADNGGDKPRHYISVLAASNIAHAKRYTHTLSNSLPLFASRKMYRS